MQIEIKLKSGRVVRATLPPGTALSSWQLAILVQWALEGKSTEVMVD